MKVTNFMMERPWTVLLCSYFFMLLIALITLFGNLFILANVMDLEAYAIFNHKMNVENDRWVLIKNDIEERETIAKLD